MRNLVSWAVTAYLLPAIYAEGNEELPDGEVGEASPGAGSVADLNIEADELPIAKSRRSTGGLVAGLAGGGLAVAAAAGTAGGVMGNRWHTQTMVKDQDESTTQMIKETVGDAMTTAVLKQGGASDRSMRNITPGYKNLPKSYANEGDFVREFLGSEQLKVANTHGVAYKENALERGSTSEEIMATLDKALLTSTDPDLRNKGSEAIKKKFGIKRLVRLNLMPQSSYGMSEHVFRMLCDGNIRHLLVTEYFKLANFEKSNAAAKYKDEMCDMEQAIDAPGDIIYGAQKGLIGKLGKAINLPADDNQKMRKAFDDARDIHSSRLMFPVLHPKDEMELIKSVALDNCKNNKVDATATQTYVDGILVLAKKVYAGGRPSYPVPKPQTPPV